MAVMSHRSDIILAVFMVAVITLLLLSVPPSLIDVLIVSNLGMAVLLLLVALYVPRPSKLISFPAILLLFTLFRLGLNVATTRLILLDGYAGEVIQSFGTFLIGGEVVVGVILFGIITVVNFVVVARGSARVAEVAARFTLDALPMKQMAIEGDMKAGLITAKEALARRAELQRESQLYGSMDGAMKFVHGDVIAGLFIILANIFGGLYIGVSRGLSFSEAIQTYTVLTVGDGLVSQIPALMVSICAGIVVTRVASSDSSSLGLDIKAQVFRWPGALIFVGALMFILGSFPGLPFLPFMLGGLAFAGLGIGIASGKEQMDIPQETRVIPLSVAQAKRELPNATESDKSDKEHVLVALDANGLYRSYVSQINDHISWWREFKDLWYQETGLVLPYLRVVKSESLLVGSYQILWKGVVVEKETLPQDSLLVELNPMVAELFGLMPFFEVIHPLTGTKAFWAYNSNVVSDISKVSNIVVYTPFQYIAMRIARYFRAYPEEIVRVSDIYEVIKEMTSRHPGLIGEVIESGIMTVPRLTYMLQQLAREGAHIGDIKGILETVATYYSIRDEEGQGNFVLQDIVDAVKEAKRREYISNYLSEKGTLRVITLSESVKEIFRKFLVGYDGYDMPPMDRTMVVELQKGFHGIYEPVRSLGVLPVAVMADVELKPAVASFIRSNYEHVGVVTQREIDFSIDVESVGVWRV